MITNPFILSGYIPDEYFCDRKAETDTLIGYITSEENVCLISPRRMGKSKLVEHCYNDARLKDYYCFYVDIYHTATLREFVYAFGKEVFATLRGKGRNMIDNVLAALRGINPKITVDAITGQPSLSLSLGDITNPEYSLSDIFKCLENADKPCVVCFDEFQQIAKYSESNIEALLRSYIQRIKNLNFIYSGSSRHLLGEMFSSYAKPFYNSAETLFLKPIDIKEYIKFVTYWFSVHNKTIDNIIVEKVYNITEGNTQNMQRMMHRLFERTKEGERCDESGVIEVFNNIVESDAERYRQLVMLLSQRQKELLYAIAAEGKAEKILSSGFIKKHSLVSSSAVQSAANKLLETDFITFDDGYYSVPDVFFRNYLVRIGG